MYALFFLMGLGVLAALIVIPAVAAAFLPWWATLLIIVAELVFLRYTFFKILGMMFAIFVSVGLRLGNQNQGRIERHRRKIMRLAIGRDPVAHLDGIELDHLGRDDRGVGSRKAGSLRSSVAFAPLPVEMTESFMVSRS